MKSFENFSRLTLNPGDTNQIHVHKDVEQVYFVVRGGGKVQVGEERKEVRAGDAIFLPANIPHGFFNTGKKTTILLLVGTKIK
jgi:quercetin dioxygenase-like cupin family protein